MTDTKAWAVIAAAFDKPVADRSVRELRLTRGGLCWAFMLAIARWHDDIIERFLPLFDYLLIPWPWRGDRGWTPDCDAERATFAALMAALTPKERAKLLEDTP